MTKLLLADDHPLFREALRGVVGRLYPGAAIHEADTLAALIALVEQHGDADLLLLDLDMPGARGFGPLVQLRAEQPQLPVVIVSAHEDPGVMRRALDHGAAGYIPKSADVSVLGQAIAQVLEGVPWVPEAAYGAQGAGPEEFEAADRLRELTPQQLRILHRVGAGQLNKQIAHELGISEATIKAHMTSIMRKLGVSNRTQAVLVAGRLGLPVELPSKGGGGDFR